MIRVKDGDTVKIHYTGKTEDQKVFTTSKDKQSIEFEIGSGIVPPSLEKGIIGMKIGATKTITVPPEEGYGLRRKELIATVMKSDLPQDSELVIGQRFQYKRADGKLADIYIIDIKDEQITIDANHPLAGHKLIFDIEIADIRQG
jgi:FKBP-type peptidyl-prolyl cis-trans isomerase 2